MCGDVTRVLIGRLRRQLAFMRPEGWVRVHHADEGDELDLDAVIEAVVDRRTGHSVDDRLHVRRDRAARDVATAFLVDLSASTSSPIPDEEALAAAAAAAQAEEEAMQYRGGWLDPYEAPPVEVGRRILDVAKESVAVMCDALELLGDRHAVYGFSGETRHHVDIHVAKEFDDRTSPATWGALAAMRSLKYTRMGPAVRHATAKLAAQPTRTKLLMVISDGYPQDVDYGPVRGDREYGLQDTAQALRDAVDAGVTPVPRHHRPGRPRLPAPDAARPLVRRHRRRRCAAARAGDAVRQRRVTLVARLVTSRRQVQMLTAASTTWRSFAHCWSAVSALPSTVLAKPHCGLRHSWSSGT